MKSIKYLLSFFLCGIAVSGLYAQCPGTAQVPLNGSSLSNNPSQVGTLLFFDDFGVSNINNGNVGRTTTPYMPATGFTFGNSYLQAGTPQGTGADPARDQARINDGHYAVVAPGYINQGWFSNDGYTTWWPPIPSKQQTVRDYSGTETGAALVINAGNLLTPFYERRGLVQRGATYRASLKIFVVKKDANLGIDILDPISREVLHTVAAVAYTTDWTDNNVTVWRDVVLDFTVPLLAGGDGCEVRDIIISFRNNQQQIDGNDWFVDNVQLEKLEDGPGCAPLQDCLRNGVTSVDLNSTLNGTIPAGSQLVWFNNQNHTGTPIAYPEAVTQTGVYYAFYFNPNDNNGIGCYNTPVSQSSVEVTIFEQCCFKPPLTGTPETTFVGISTLNRNVNEWLADENQNKLGSYIALESTNKAFVITRNANPATNIADPVEGMVVWDTTDNCLKLYKGATIGWVCTSNQCSQPQ